MIIHGTLDVEELAQAYAGLAIDLFACGAEFERAGELLAGRRLEKAEDAIQRGLDLLAKVVADLPRVEEND